MQIKSLETPINIISVSNHFEAKTTKCLIWSSPEQLVSTFRSNVWIAILLLTLFIALVKSGLQYKFSKLKMLSCLGFYWTTFIAILGGKPTPTPIDSKKSYKLIVFVSLLSGVLIWMFYRSFIIASLSVQVKEYPFNDMESLSKTKWRYAC